MQPESVREKNPARVRAGQARMRQLRAALERDGKTLSDYQSGLYQQTLDKHPDFHSKGGKAGFEACAAKYGYRFALERVKAARERRRQQRLAGPTPGEAALRGTLAGLGFSVQLPQERFDYLDWTVDPIDWALGAYDALAEGSVGSYDCDVLLPVQQIAIEVHGGVHCLTADRDATKHACLEQHGLTVVVFQEAEALDPHHLLARLRNALQLPRSG